MLSLLTICIIILVVIILFLLGKIYYLHMAVNEIIDGFQEKLLTDTNTKITISSRDFYMKKLVREINKQLHTLRTQERKYLNGDRELKEAVTNISHDLRTPLTAIIGYLDLLECEEKSENVQRYISQIKNRTESLKNLTEELFRYSVVTTTQELRLEQVDMVRELEESILSFYAVIQEKGIQPEISLPENPIWRVMDAESINRIFSNIISNMIKYSDGDLSVSMDESGYITFSNMAKSLNTVEVGRLFDRFYTVEVSRNSTGLGLSIAKVLTERMGGNISAYYQNERLYVIIDFHNFTK